MMPCAGKLASRAIRQYRSRDIFPYLSLRYFLDSAKSRTDQFARLNAIQVVRGSKTASYLEVQYFKDRDDAGAIRHRSMHMPSAIEALAEAAILEECAKKLPIPDRESCYSYWPTQDGSPSGYFEPYMVGLKKRQTAVAAAISQFSDGADVRYVDIKTFYPSINVTTAKKYWESYSREANLSNRVTKAGLNLLRKHKLAGDGKSILTGPMFSHFIGNLILRDIDDKMKNEFTCKVFRYVDDFIFVGQAADIKRDVDALAVHLRSLGLEIHPEDSEKSISLSGESWLRSERDFESGKISISWMNLVGDIKKLLLSNMAGGQDLTQDLRALGFRMPIGAYEAAVKEASSFEKIRNLGLWRWLLYKLRGVSGQSVVEQAKNLRDILNSQILDLLESPIPIDIFERKRLATKLRYRLGRALYICEDNFLADIQNYAKYWPELEVHFAIARAIVSKQCDHVVSMGVNVSQATAQIFAASDETAFFESEISNEVSAMGLAVFIVNGVPVECATVIDRAILQVATGPISLNTMENSTGFIRQLACLHGIGDARHGEMMRKAFEVGEDVHFDAISLDYGYSF